MAKSEEELIALVREVFPPVAQGVGIGDDAAVVSLPGKSVVTSDMLIEGVDFLSHYPARFVASKAVQVNLSDLAAMGARPVSLLISLAFPPSRIDDAESIIHALGSAAREANVSVLGGDLSRAESMILSIMAIGTLDDGVEPLLRSGARSGERIYVSRPLGASAGGLKLLLKGWSIDAQGEVSPPEGSRPLGYAQREFAAAIIRAHVDPKAEVALGRQLAQQKLATACIDISDGLSSDLHRLVSASSAGAVIEWERLPVYPDLHRTGFTLGIDSDKTAIHGGEEYALLFTSPLLESELSSRIGRPVYQIGRVTKKPGVRMLRDQKETELAPAGFDHFLQS